MADENLTTEISEAGDPCCAVLEAQGEGDEKPIRILVAMEVYLPTVDGVVNCMRNLLLNYPESVEATAVGPEAKGYRDTDPYPVLRFKGFRIPFTEIDFGFPSRDKDFFRKVMAMDIDLIHVHTPFGVCKVLTKIAARKQIPIVATFHTNYRMVFKKILLLKCFYEPYVRRLGRRYSAMNEMFAGTEATERMLRSFGYRGTCSIVPFGTSLRPVADPEALAERANERFGLEPGQTVFCYIGRIVRSKRVQFSFKALKAIKKKGYDFKFIVAGTGNYARALKRAVKRLGLEENVILAGFVSDEELEIIYSRANLLLFPSIQDTFALVKVEAATYDTPGLYIRGTDTAFGTTEMHNSLLSEDSVTDFVDKIEWAITHPDELRKIGKNAHAELYFSWKDSARLMAKEYRRVIAEYRRKRDASEPTPQKKEK